MKYFLLTLLFLGLFPNSFADDLESELEALDGEMPIETEELTTEEADELNSISSGFDLEEQLELEEQYSQQDQEEFSTENPIEEEVDLKMIDYLNIKQPRHYGGRRSKRRLKRTTPYMAGASFRGMLKKGSKILHLKSKKWYRTRRNIYVRTRHNTKAKNETYLYNNRGQILYVTALNNVINIESDLDAMPKPKQYETYLDNPIDQSYSYNYSLGTSHTLNIHFEKNNAAYFNQFFGREDLDSSGTRVEYQLYFPWSVPIDLGLNLNYQSSSFGSGHSDLSWQSFFYGPSLRFPLYRNNKLSVRGYIGYHQSFSFDAIYQQSDYKFSANGFQYSIKCSYDTEFGRFSAGLTYRKLRVSYKDSSTSISISQNKGDLKSFGPFIGYEFELLL